MKNTAACNIKTNIKNNVHDKILNITQPISYFW